MAVLLNRPHDAHIETVNDLDCYLANFWRALQADPDGVARWADWPVNEADLQARHLWLVRRETFRERMKADPDFYDSKIAGWWVWGICQWIGRGWCDEKKYQPEEGTDKHRPALSRPQLLGSMGVHRVNQDGNLHDYMTALADRLRRVRVCCGDWSRVLGPSPTYLCGSPCAVFLDSPYSSEYRDQNIYSVESVTVAHDVRDWAIANGDNPQLRIALCGYEGEHEMPNDWETVAWKAMGGYGRQNSNGNPNASRERIWFSPHCLKPDEAVPQLSLFDARDDG